MIIPPINSEMEQRKSKLEALIASLESELTQKLFQHKKFIESTKSVEEERNFYYGNLRSIEHYCKI
jgi:hypothetical protein